MESDKENLQYPPPPDYFKEFTTADKYSPPKLSSLERMDKFISFGSEYSTKKLNISLNPVNVKSVGKKLLKVSKSRNIEKFETLEKKSDLDIDIDDSLSIISEADSVLDNFKNDILEETEFNNGNKIIPLLSSEFIKKFQKK